MKDQMLENIKGSILLTGGCGYIASHTAVVLQEAGYGVILVDNLSNSRREVVDAITRITSIRPAFYEVDCTDTAALSDIFKRHEDEITGVIHFSAHKAVGESVAHPLHYYYNNINSLISVLRCMERYGVKHLVFSSSCTVYGQPTVEHLPISESEPRQGTTSPYGNTKRINEDIILDTVHSGTPLQAVILRYFNPIGAHPSALIGEEPIGTPQNIIPLLTQTVAGLRPELVIFGNDYNTPDGTCIRDYMDVMDLAQAHLAALERLRRSDVGADPTYYTYNVGMGHGVSVLELIQAFERATGLLVPYRIGERRSGDIEQIWADTRYGEKELQWHAQTPLEESLRRAWHWQETLNKRQGSDKSCKI